MRQSQACRIVALAGFFVTQSAAVEPGQPSKTSILVTAARALGARDYDPSVRNPDWLAEHFLGAAERAMLADSPMIRALEQDYREAIRELGGAGFFIVRTRFIDERLRNAVTEGATQVVILGAGFDSRAYRMRELLKSTKIFEVDYGPTQEYKKIRVREVLGCSPPNLTYVPIDFTRERVGDALVKSGYRSSEKTFFIWEGVTYYISEEAVRSTFHFVATQSASGSSVVFDGQSKSFIDWVASNIASPENAPEGLRRALMNQKLMASWGEPWIFGFPDGHEREFLESVGLEIREIMPLLGPETTKRYLTRRDGSVLAAVEPGVSAKTPLPFRGAWIAEAAVPGH
jgi:methyltransferase (TIGR00027 family)